MITRWYEVSCDYCGSVINHYKRRKPSREELSVNGAFTTATKQFCNVNCYSNYMHDLNEKRYLNINPSGRIHIEKGDEL